jgi:hypothetical protein
MTPWARVEKRAMPLLVGLAQALGRLLSLLSVVSMLTVAAAAEDRRGGPPDELNLSRFMSLLPLVP